ncbi:hypothetical protein [Caulobacter sp. BK020]|uniref:hypothetical protein n=1 Tax=Caulobacter sp. BK020 TaxID=2512117 RepID=UPI00104BD199|nr:hypothetical protein [Caulobacter sp. BK020]TCS16080.1 hypothetical protein EV278_104254 [Caulobacter sp. BK020]
MATITVSDFVIWAKHIHGDDALAARVAGLGAGEILSLTIDGVEGPWRKMDDGKDGRPTPGVRPLGRAQEFWRELYRTRRGDVVSLEVHWATQPGVEEQGAAFETRAVEASRRLVRTDESRQAALDAFLALAGQGWKSEGRTMTRDEMHAR